MRSALWRGVAAGVFAAWVCAGGPRDARADDVTITARVEPATVEVGGQALLTIEVEGKFRRSAAPELPPLGDFDVYEAGTSQNFSFVNGQAHSSITFSYMLSPRKEGTFRIEPIRLSLGDKQYTANPVVVQVVAGSAAIPVPNAPPAAGGSPGTDLPSQDESIFVAAAVDRDTVYVNEQVTWTLGYYADGRVELLRAPNYSPPSAEGFWVEDLPPQNKYYATIHNRRFLVSEIKRAYFPTAPGVYTIGEARIDIVLDDMRGRFDDFFNRGFRGGGFGEQRSLATQAKKIVVLPLPASGKPSDFGGAVASDLTVSLVADKQMAQVGEPINVSMEVNGVGNMRTLPAPKFSGLDGFKVYESGNATDSFKKDYLVSGRRRFDYVMVPQTEGKFTLPGTRIAYYDPRRHRYEVAQAAAIPIEVKPGTHEDGGKVIYAGGDDFEVLNRDIRYIHPLPAVLAAARAPFYAQPLFLLLQALPALGVVASLAVERRRRRLRDDVSFARASRAARDAERRLGAAEKSFRSGSVEAGYGAIHAALFGYFADRMNAPVAGLTRDAIEAYLSARQVGDTQLAAIRSVIDACDAARYAAGPADADAGSRLARAARDAIHAVERAFR
jgi:BatD DUF11 like domain